MSTSSPVSSSSATSTPEAAAATAANKSGSNSVGGLTQADFLQIMVAQFENQDPLSDSDSGGSSGTSDYVEELMSMTNITTLQTMSQQQAIELAGSLPGSTVTLTDSNGNAVSGEVTGAAIQNTTLYITVNGTAYPASDISSITQTQAQAAAAASSTASTGTSGTSSTTPTSS